MRFQLTIVFAFALLLGTAGAWAKVANISGAWTLVYVSKDGNPINLKFVLKQDGEKITGRYSGPYGEHDVTGTVKGGKAVFGFDLKSPASPSPFTVNFNATIESPSKMTGTVGSPFCGTECKWTGTKNK